MSRIALTPGEPAGIGPDLTVMLAQTWRAATVVAICDRNLLAERAATLGLPLKTYDFDPDVPEADDPPGTLCVLHVPLPQTAVPGTLAPVNAQAVLTTLDRAMDGCRDGTFDAMVTAPIHKGVINDAGIAFTGHTEYLAERLQSTPVMMLTAGTLRVALATTHMPLSKVAESIRTEPLERTIRTLHADLIKRFRIADPVILVSGLNPHAGEGGHLGREEIEIIAPLLERLVAEGLKLIGPLPADTMFTPHHLAHADAVLVMYHDQGLPVLKFSGFGTGVNITLGLPIVRTSVDHGTALDKAGGGDIDTGSLRAALELAIDIAAASGAAPREEASRAGVR